MWIYEKYPAYRKCQCLLLLSFQVGGSMVKNLPASTGDLGDTGLTLGLRRSPGRGNGNTFQYSCLENCMDRGTWRITVQCPKESDMTQRLSMQLLNARKQQNKQIFRNFTFLSLLKEGTAGGEMEPTWGIGTKGPNPQSQFSKITY